MNDEPWWLSLSSILSRMDWMAWVLAALALTSAIACAVTFRERMVRGSTDQTGPAVVLALGAIVLGWAIFSYFKGASDVAEALAVVNPADAQQIEAVARAELSTRFAFSVAASLPALVFGIVFLRPGPPAPPSTA